MITKVCHTFYSLAGSLHALPAPYRCIVCSIQNGEYLEINIQGHLLRFPSRFTYNFTISNNSDQTDCSVWISAFLFVATNRNKKCPTYQMTISRTTVTYFSTKVSKINFKHTKISR